MRTSMAIPIRFWAALLAGLLMYQYSTEASADWCEFEKVIDLSLDLSGSNTLVITAAAGDLDVQGTSDSDQAVIHGKVCVSKQAWLDDATIETMEGERAKIFVNLPDSSGGWSLFGGSYATMDLTVRLPHNMALEVKDSSGDATFRNIGAMNLQDSSGDIEIEDATGPITIKDSSGDIEIENVGNAVSIRDSSGDIEVDHLTGNFTIEADSSGDIRATNIDGTVLVKKDSSGDISVKTVSGDFRVLADGSGSIHSKDVQGAVETPKDG